MDQHQLTDVQVDEVSLVGRPANMRKYLLFKNQEGAPAVGTAPAIVQPTPAELAKSVIAGLDDAGKADLRKALFPEMDEQIAALTKSRDEAASQVEALQKSVADMQRASKRAEYVALAKAEGFVHGSPEEHADRLLEMGDKMGAEAVEKAIEREKAIAAALKTSGLLTEIGKSGAGALVADTARGELDRRARERLAKSESKDYSAALDAVLASDATLAARVNAEIKGGR